MSHVNAIGARQLHMRSRLYDARVVRCQYQQVLSLINDTRTCRDTCRCFMFIGPWRLYWFWGS